MCLRKVLIYVIVMISCTNPEYGSNYDYMPSDHIKEYRAYFNVHRVSQSFVYIQNLMELKIETCNENGICTIKNVNINSSIGSGMTIKRKGKTYVITAGHVCEPRFYNSELLIYDYMGETQITITGTGYYNNQSKFTILGLDVVRDVCILEALDTWESPGLTLAKKAPKQGEVVYMASAPYGIFEPGMILVYDGYFAGFDSDHDMIVSIPTRPGSSGSSIVDKNEKVVGVIHSAILDMENIGIGTPIDVVHELFDQIDNKN